MRGKIYIIALFLLSLIPLFDLFKNGLPITHDGIDHVVRISNFYQNLTQGNLIPRWAGNLNWGFGHPILEFLYPFPSYIASIFHLIGFSLIDATKIVFGLGMPLSGLFMYLWLREFLGEKEGFIGGLIYMFTPYRFVELYVRGDIGENLAFAFMPLALFFILRLSKKINTLNVVGGSVAISLLILSHNGISLMYMPFVIFYCLYLLYLSKNKFLLFRNFLYLILLGFALSAFFWVPALIEGKYTLRNIVTSGSYLTRFVDIKSLFYSSWSYGGSGEFSVQLGIVNWLTIFFIPFFLFFLRKQKKIFILILGITLYTLISIFLMLKQSNFIWGSLILLQNFQFPWRFLAIPVFSTAVFGAILVYSVSKGTKTIVFIVLLFAILFFNKDYWHAKGYVVKSDNFFNQIYNGTTDTGESAPIWSVRFMEQRPKNYIDVISGHANITNLKRSMTMHNYKIIVEEKSRIVENTLYFPGWEVLVDGKKTNVEFQDQNYRGLMTFDVDKGAHLVQVMYSETKLRAASDMISLASLLAILVGLGRNIYLSKAGII